MEICFKCMKCNHEFEEEIDGEFITEDAVDFGITPECPNCGSSYTYRE